MSEWANRQRAWREFAAWEAANPVDVPLSERYEWLRVMWEYIAEHDPRPPRDPELIASNVEALHAHLAALR